MSYRSAIALVLLIGSFSLPSSAAESSSAMVVGAAKLDITPDFPVRLAGYSSRREPSEGVAQRLWAKALVFGKDEGDGPAVLVTVDNCGVPAPLVKKVRERLADKGVHGDRLVVCSSHSHCCPWLVGYAPFLSQDELPAEQQQLRERYTREVEDAIVKVVQTAMQQRQPANLFWGEGKVGFAANRRVLRDQTWKGFGVQPKGPVDHRLPLLVVKDAAGKPLAIWATYACHCTTLGGEFNRICGDWSGFAQRDIEEEFPSAVNLISIGCGADANPEPRGKLEYAEQHGRALADEVKRLLREGLKPVADPGTAVLCRHKQIELPFDQIPDRATWERLAKAAASEGMRGRYFLSMLDRGEAIPKTLDYPVSTWNFANKLAFVFLGGEVVVDYARRISDEFQTDRLCVVAYANDVPCYIASKRILKEGGYEADTSMIYYGRPTRFAPQTEDVILRTVHELLPSSFVK